VDAAECNDEYDALAECMKDMDVCELEDLEECSDEAVDYNDCDVEYCTDDGTPLDIDEIPGECEDYL